MKAHTCQVYGHNIFLLGRHSTIRRIQHDHYKDTFIHNRVANRDEYVSVYYRTTTFCQTPVLGLGLGVDFTFTLDNKNNNNNPHLNFLKGTVLGVQEQGLGLRNKG